MTLFAPQRSEVLDLIAAGLRAPSADNQHHVRFGISPEGLAVRADNAFLTGDERHRRALTLLSFGAIGENLRLRLQAMGWRCQPRWFPEPTDPGLVLDIAWASLEPCTTIDPLAAHIESRHTNRRFYRGPSLSSAERGELEVAMAEAPDATLEWFDTPERRRALLRLVRLAETARFGNRRLHAEMFESIDFDAGWKHATTTRLAPATLEVEPFLRVPFALMRHWPVMRFANRLGAHRVLGLRAGDLPARWSPHVAALTSTLPPDRAALAVGVAFQRVWLAAEGAGLALQPMVASAILTTPDDADRGIGAATRSQLRRGWDSLIGEATPLVVFRLGRASRPRVVSGRGPVEDFLL